MRISDWSSDVCSSDLVAGGGARRAGIEHGRPGQRAEIDCGFRRRTLPGAGRLARNVAHRVDAADHGGIQRIDARHRSEAHTYELQSLMRSAYAVYCLKKIHIHISGSST